MKVAIVGCKGSGKTVLMSVLGVKYEKPDKNGIFLNPKDKQTLHICNENVGCMQDEAKWPLATSPDATECLQWEIMRKVADDPCDTIADLCFLDFAGEIYTGGWGGDNIGNLSAEAQKSLAQLKFHVKEADVLIVLINLRDIINGQRGDASTDSMEWAARTVFSYVYNEAKPSKVALVFTQSDMYENIIAERGSLQNVLKEYMPNIDVRFGNRLALFSVAAVATTEPAPDDGSPLPARNFESKGLEELMLWMADYCLEVRRNELRRMRRKRVRRGFAASIVLLFLLGLFTWKAYNVSPMFRAWVDWQVLAAMELFLPAWVEGSPHPDNPYLKAGEHRNTWVSTRLGYVWTKGTDKIEWSPGLKPSGWPHVTASDNEGIWTLEDGYEWEFPDQVEKGVFSVKWTPGRTHSRNEHLESDEQEGKWKSTKPGYVWIEGTDKIEWSPGLKHPGNEHLESDEQEGKWKSTKPGRVWKEGTDELKWTSGLPHPNWPHVISAVEEGKWHPEAGYDWVAPKDAVNWTVVWKPGLKHPGNEHLESDEQEGKWKSTKPGWVWEEGTDAIKWKKGLSHPKNPNLVSGELPDTWVSTRPGYVWEESTDKIKWEKGLKHPRNEHLESDEQEGKWKSTKPGRVWKEGTDEIVWTSGLPYPNCPHVISDVEEGMWHPEAGYGWKDVEAMKKGDWTVVWKPNLVFGDRKTASKEGEWLTKCNECDNGEKTVACNVKCSNCQGNGTTEIEETCDECNGRGTVTPEKDTLGWLVALKRCSSCIDGRTACSWGCRLVNLPPFHSFSLNLSCSNKSAHNLGEGNWRSDKELHSVWGSVCVTCSGVGSVVINFLGNQMPCLSCGGMGGWPCLGCRGQGNKCKKCSGAGFIPGALKCGTCEGEGKKLENIQCNVCKGTGEVEKTQKKKCLQCEDGWRRL